MNNVLKSIILKLIILYIYNFLNILYISFLVNNLYKYLFITIKKNNTKFYKLKF